MRQKLVDFRFLERIRQVAINAAKLASAGLHRHKSDRLPALWAVGRRRIFGHLTRARLTGGIEPGESITPIISALIVAIASQFRAPGAGMGLNGPLCDRRPTTVQF